MTAPSDARRLAERILSLLVAAFGTALLPGGLHLIALGGSWYYAACGTVLLVTAVLQWRSSRWTLPSYASLLLLTLLWGLSEVGLDFWALLARTALLLVVGGFVYLAAPRRVADTSMSWSRRMSAVVAVLTVATLVASLGQEPMVIAAAQPSVSGGAYDATGNMRQPAPGDWLAYGNTPAGTRFSPLTQINRSNVVKLHVVWSYRFNEPTAPGLQVTPLKIGDLVYACSASNRVVALDAESGVVRWLFDPKADIDSPPYRACRGVGYHRAREGKSRCAERIYTNTVDARVIALDAQTGERCLGFGVDGEVSMLEGLGEHPEGYYYYSGAPTVARDRIVLGGLVVDNQKWGEPSGVIRALDAVSGDLVWAYDVGRPDAIGAPAPGETYTHSTPNSWAQMAFDDELGLVYVPTGNATPDYYGAQRRPFDDDISSAVMALDIETGRRRWVVQTVHHDIWDYDVGSQPVLVDLATPSGVDRALIQATKRGELFLLDRATGAPLAEIIDRNVPTAGAAPDERVAPTQPFSVGMPSFAGEPLSEQRMWGLTPFDHLWCRIRFLETRYEGPMTPPGLTASLTYPGYLGGMDWGSVSIDPERGLMIAPSNHVANYTQLFPRDFADAAGWMPMGEGKTGARAGGGVYAQAGTPFAAKTQPFWSPLQIPCNQPPWGKLHAVDLRTRKVLWSRALGTTRVSGPLGIRSRVPLPIGVPLLGGALITRGGLTFIGATIDETFRAIDVDTGEILWTHDLPKSGIATPMTYESASGRQFVVIAAGGHAATRKTTGDQLLAFALPQENH